MVVEQSMDFGENIQCIQSNAELFLAEADVKVFLVISRVYVRNSLYILMLCSVSVAVSCLKQNRVVCLML